MNIVLLEPLAISESKLNQLAAGLRGAGHTFVSYGTPAPDDSVLLERAKDADVLILANHPLSNEVVRGCGHLQYISVAFVGIDHIGREACLERSIPVSNAAAYCTHAVAELALGLCLDCLRSISECNRIVREGGTKDGLIGHQLYGKTVGIIGTGDTGCATARLFSAFGCRVLGYSRTEREDVKASGIEYVPLNSLLRQSDIVSVHTPLTPQTQGMINAERIAMMKHGAILINTARGPIVDSSAAANALASGHLAAMGTDVFESEPPVSELHPLFSAPHVVATPHIAFATQESLEKRAEITFENVYSWLAGTVLRRML